MILARLRRVFRDRSGRLYELNILVAFVVVAALIAIGQRSLLKGLGIATLWLLGFFAAVMLLYLLSEAAERVRELECVKRLLASRVGRFLKPMGIGLLSATAGAAAAGFLSIFLAPKLSGSPDGQLLSMRVLTAAGGVIAGVLAFRAAK